MDKETRKQFYREQYYKEQLLHQEQDYKAWWMLNERQLSNSQMLDRAILSLSSAGLALSLAFMKTVVQANAGNNEVTDVHFLYISWWAFVLAIILTLISFLTSNYGLEKQFDQLAEKFKDTEGSDSEDVEDNTSENNEKKTDLSDMPFELTTLLSWCSLKCYAVAIIFTVLFVQSNVVFPGSN